MLNLNLILDPWIPVRCMNGERRIIAPWEITASDIVALDWPRPDLNIACYELLIGLVFLVDPPEDIEDWDDRCEPQPQRLRERLEKFSSAFNLLGDGPRFLQDFEALEGDENPVDMLFIDSAGANTARNNADMMVRRGRYGRLDLPTAAMALYALQSFAPSGGAGNRTSMRGGGPMVTLANPEKTLWDLVWANVPYGISGCIDHLPWMRPTRLSNGSEQVFPTENVPFDKEVFFGMPRRLRLSSDGECICGVVQKPYGTNYAHWRHPLTPYYRQKPGTEWLPKHPRAGHFSYRNWLGILLAERENSLTETAQCLRQAAERSVRGSVIVAGWSMDNMKPRDFILSRQRLLSGMSFDKEQKILGLIHAADGAANALREALKPVLAAGEEREAEQEEFFAQTGKVFLKVVQSIESGESPSSLWLKVLRQQALKQFEKWAVPCLAQREVSSIKRIVDSRKYLTMYLLGYGKRGASFFNSLGLPLPEKKRTAS